MVLFDRHDRQRRARVERAQIETVQLAPRHVLRQRALWFELALDPRAAGGDLDAHGQVTHGVDQAFVVAEQLARRADQARLGWLTLWAEELLISVVINALNLARSEPQLVDGEALFGSR